MMILAGPSSVVASSICVRFIRESQRILFNAIRIALKNKELASNLLTELSSRLRPFLYEKQNEPIIIPMILTLINKKW